MLRAFGLTLSSAIDLPGAWTERSASGRPDLELVAAGPEELANAFSGTVEDRWRGTPDGRSMMVSLGLAGDVIVTLDGAAAFHFDPKIGRLRCHLPQGDLTAMRVLLDSVLFTAALVHGYEVLHCGAVLAERGVVAVAADTGGGKSTLLTELVAEGAGFFADDIVALARSSDGPPVAYAGPPLLTRPGPPARAIGEPIGEVGGETWCGVEVAADNRPLAALVLLDRSGVGNIELERLPGSPIPVMSRFVAFPQARERERARFELAADIASHVSLYRLEAAPDAPPSELAAALQPALA